MDTRNAARLFAVLVLAARLGQSADFFFLQMSDPQLGMYTADRDFAQETANFEFAIATANRLRPAFVVVCGDLINKPGNAAQAAEYLRIASKLDRAIPLYSVAGNHDVGNEPTAQSLSAYRQKFGRDYYAFQHGGFRGLVLDSSLIQHPDRAPEEAARQRHWLESELAGARRRGMQSVVFQHIPWFLAEPNEPDQYFNIPRATRQKYLELFRRNGVEHVFAGHYHRNAYGEGPRLHVVATGPLGKPLGADPSGIRVVTVRGSKIESRYYGLGNLPNQVDLTAVLR